MELMSSLLLFALTLLPQTLGKSNGKISYDAAINNSMSGKQKTNQNILFDIPHTTGKVSDLQSVFTNASCKKCISCMERAIKAHKIHNCVAKNNLNAKMRRDKRKANNNGNSKMIIQKSKSKKNKLITLFKYVEKKHVYALKVKETSTHYDNNITRLETKCDVYKVQKYYPCDASEANSILRESKMNKRNKKEAGKNATTAQKRTTPPTAYVFRKRPGDDIQNSESFLSSVEEVMY